MKTEFDQYMGVTCEIIEYQMKHDKEGKMTRFRSKERWDGARLRDIKVEGRLAIQGGPHEGALGVRL